MFKIRNSLHIEKLCVRAICGTTIWDAQIDALYLCLKEACNVELEFNQKEHLFDYEKIKSTLLTIIPGI